MKILNQFVILTVLFLLLLNAQVVAAEPVLDQVVKNFLSKNIKSQSEQSKQSEQMTNETLPVLILYKSNLTDFKSNKPSDHAEVQKAMMALNRQSQAEAFGSMIFNSVLDFQNLWIINGTLASLNTLQLQNLIQNDQIKSISFSLRKIKMQKTEKDFSFTLNNRFTYGLVNMKIPDLRAQYPQILGRQVRVGVIDTGLEANHPDLKNKLQVFKNFSPAQNQQPEDGFGHGTHVSGTIVGGSASGQFIGVAPEAQLIFARIFDNNGESTEAQILQAMQWVADPDLDPTTNDFAQVVNNSWSDDAKYNLQDSKDNVFCQVIDAWVKLGIVPVFSAGNTGPNEATINIPGACPSALTVGATEQYDRSPRFSSEGPAIWKSISLIKPDVSAPGVDIYSCSGRNDYEKMSGTSMAAPHITGVMALILQAQPNLSVDEAKNALTQYAKDLGDPGKDNTFGWGRADALNSIQHLLKK